MGIYTENIEKSKFKVLNIRNGEIPIKLATKTEVEDFVRGYSFYGSGISSLPAKSIEFLLIINIFKKTKI